MGYGLRIINKVDEDIPFEDQKVVFKGSLSKRIAILKDGTEKDIKIVGDMTNCTKIIDKIIAFNIRENKFIYVEESELNNNIVSVFSSHIYNDDYVLQICRIT